MLQKLLQVYVKKKKKRKKLLEDFIDRVISHHHSTRIATRIHCDAGVASNLQE